VKKKEEENPTCSHCEKKEHEEEKCWKFHPELKLKWAQPRKGKNNTTTIVHDLGSDSEDETNVTVMGINRKYYVASFNLHTSSSKSKVISNGSQRKELFHL